jgi:membrane protein YdbS with pleckstrin-like domain
LCIKPSTVILPAAIVIAVLWYFCHCHWHGVVVAAIATIAVAKAYASDAPFVIFDPFIYIPYI